MDALLYLIYDYHYDIEVLEKLKIAFENQDREDTLEYKAVEELIDEYSQKYLKTVRDIDADLRAAIFVNIAKRNPVVSIVLMASEILIKFTAVEDKVSFLILDYYRSPFETCILPARDLYFNGIINSDIKELKLFVSLYLHLMREYNQLAVNIAIHESTDDEYVNDIYVLNNNIEKIDSLLHTYF